MIMNQENSCNSEGISFNMPPLLVNQNTVSMQMVQFFHSFQGAHQQESVPFSSHVQQSQTVHTGLMDQNSIRFPSFMFSTKKPNNRRKSPQGFVWSQEQEQKQQSRFQQVQIQENNPNPMIIQERNGEKTPQFCPQFKIPSPIKFKSKQSNSKYKPRKRQTRGLKELSFEIKEILEVEKSATYKELAEMLLMKHNLFPDSNGSHSPETVEKLSKSNLNLKRRVYDALNVLVSIGMLRRQNKKLFINSQGPRISHRSQIQSKKAQSLQDKLNQAKKTYHQKKKILQFLQIKHRVLQKLVNRNKNVLTLEQQKVQGTFVVIESQNLHEDDMIIDDEENMMILADTKVRISSNLDCLTKFEKQLFDKKQ